MAEEEKVGDKAHEVSFSPFLLSSPHVQRLTRLISFFLFSFLPPLSSKQRRLQRKWHRGPPFTLFSPSPRLVRHEYDFVNLWDQGALTSSSHPFSFLPESMRECYRPSAAWKGGPGDFTFLHLSPLFSSPAAWISGAGNRFTLKPVPPPFSFPLPPPNQKETDSRLFGSCSWNFLPISLSFFPLFMAITVSFISF